MGPALLFAKDDEVQADGGAAAAGAKVATHCVTCELPRQSNCQPPGRRPTKPHVHTAPAVSLSLHCAALGEVAIIAISRMECRYRNDGNVEWYMHIMEDGMQQQPACIRRIHLSAAWQRTVTVKLCNGR